MKGDFTRFTHRPEKHYTRVLKQQGRVDLDADWNESVEITTHLERTEAIDVIGRCGVPIHGGGFEIETDGADLTISRGRIYVDGILCSNEVEGKTAPIPLTGQPDLPKTSPALDDGVYLVYLDVWERHVTALEDPEIREVALGGPDTTTRTRTICQVKLEPLREDVPFDQLRCRPFEGLPANGRLAAQAEAADQSSNPCVVPAAAGYRGLENRLYRVEIHDDGRDAGGSQVRTPTFKWSRDNGSVVLPVAEIGTAGDEVTLKRLGPDKVLTVKVGHWVEVSGDETELRGRHGTLARIAPDGIDKASLEITLVDQNGADADVSAHSAEGHLKLRRWDHHATDEVALVGGALPIQGAWFELEDGVQVRFDTAATYHVGDYWVIPARTREGSVLWPRKGTPPADVARELPRLGIEHHYCTLALARRQSRKWTAVRDCRPRFPPLTEVGWCCVTVAPGEDVQKALDSLPDGSVDPDRVGGCVCLKTGVHEITAPLRIEKSNVVLHGEGAGAVVRHTGGGSRMLHISDPRGREISHCRVQDIRFKARTGSDALSYLIHLENCREVTLRDSRVGADPTALAGVVIEGGVAVRVERCAISGAAYGIVICTDSTDASVLANRLSGGDFQKLGGITGVLFEDAAGAGRVEGNDIAGFQIGVEVDEGAAGSVVASNRVERAALLDPSAGKAFGIDVAASRCRVRDNDVAIPGAAYGGIQLAADGVWVENNRLLSRAAGEDPSDLAGAPPLGIRVEGGEDAVIRSNLLTGMQDAIEVVSAFDVQVLDNEIGADDEPLREAIGLDGAVNARVAGNRVRNAEIGIRLSGGAGNRVFDNHLEGGDAGIRATDEDSLEIDRNTVENMSEPGFEASGLETSVVVRGNRFVSCGYAATAASVSIGFCPEVRVESCDILDTGIPPDGGAASQPAIGILLFFVEGCAVQGNLVRVPAALERNLEDRALWVLGSWAFRLRLTDRLTLAYSIGSALVLKNKFYGPGQTALVEVPWFEVARPTETYSVGFGFDRLDFSHNHLEHYHGEPGDRNPASASLDGTRMTVIGNHVRGLSAESFESPFPSFDFHGQRTVLFTGNMATGNTIRHPDPRPTPKADHNFLDLIL